MSSEAAARDGERARPSRYVPPIGELPARDDSFTMAEAARIKGVSYHTVSRAVRSNRLPARRSGRMVLIASRDLDAWQPMRERAPRKYRHRTPEPRTAPGVVDLASGERAELARRLSALYEMIHTCALHQPLDRFTQWLAERFAQAMEFDRVAIWLINVDRTEIEHLAWFGDWYGSARPTGPIRFPFDPATMYRSPPGVSPIACWSDPPPVRLGVAFSAPLIADQQHLGYIIGDRNGAPFTLTDAQIQLGQSLATQAAITIDLNRARQREVRRAKELELVLDQISEPVLVYDANERITAMSQVARRTYGLPDDLDLAVAPFSLHDLDRGFHERDGRGPVDPPSERALAGDVVRGAEFRFVRHDTGEERLLLVDAVPILADDGAVTTVVAVERDVTDQRAIEDTERRRREELERALERMRMLASFSLAVNAADDLSAVLREAGRLLTLAMESPGGISIQTDGDSITSMWAFGDATQLDGVMPVNLHALPGAVRAFQTGKPTLHAYEQASEAERSVLDAIAARSCLITPFSVDGEPVGVVYAKHPAGNPKPAVELIEFGEALAAQCVPAIEYVRLRREIETERQALHAAITDCRRLAAELGTNAEPGVRARLATAEALVAE